MVPCSMAETMQDCSPGDVVLSATIMQSADVPFAAISGHLHWLFNEVQAVLGIHIS